MHYINNILSTEGREMELLFSFFYFSLVVVILITQKNNYNLMSDVCGNILTNGVASRPLISSKKGDLYMTWPVYMYARRVPHTKT